MSIPMGVSLGQAADSAEQWERAHRLSVRTLAEGTFASHTNPMRAARATLSLRTVFPWLTPNLAAKMGAFGVQPDDPGVIEIAGAALARRARRGMAEVGERRSPAEVRNVTAPRSWRDVPLEGRVALPQATVDQAVSEIFGVDPAMTPTDQLAQMRQAFYTGRSLNDVQSTPDRIIPETPEVAALEPVSAEDLQIPTGSQGVDYLRGLRQSGVEIPRGGPRATRIRRGDPDVLASRYPALAESFRANRTTFEMARNIEQGQGDANLAFQIREPGADPQMAAELAQSLPSMDATVSHIRRGGLTFQGIPLPGGEVSPDELAQVYDGPNRDTYLDALRRERDRLDGRYDSPDEMPRSVRAVYDGINSIFDDLIGPQEQSLGPDFGEFNASDLWNVPYDAARGTVRTATMVMDSAWQAGQAKFRAIIDDPGNLNNYRGLDPLNAGIGALGFVTGHDIPGTDEEFLGETDYGLALQHLANGDSVDVGTGFFNTPDTPLSQERLANEQTHGLIGGHVITMGRWAADTSGLEPDTLPFDIVSGTVDLAWMLVEPGGAAVDALTRSRGARDLLAAAGGFAPTRSIHPERFAEFLADTPGTRAIDRLAESTDDLDRLRLWESMSQSGGSSRMPGWAMYTLTDGAPGDTEYVSEMLANLTGMGYSTPGVALRGENAVPGLGAIVAPGVAFRRRLGVSRLATVAPDTGAHAGDIYNADELVQQAISSMRNARVPEAEIARIVRRIYTEGYEIPTRVRVQQLERELAALPDTGTVIRNGEEIDVAAARSDITDTIDELRPGLFINRPTPRANVLHDIWFNDMQEVKRARLVEAGLDESMAEELTHLDDVGRRIDTRMADDHQREGAYYLRLTTDDSTEGAVNRRMWPTIDGEATTDLGQPSFAHLAAEHQGRYLPLEEDYRQLARLTRSVPNQILTAWLSSPTDGHLFAPWRGVESFMSRVWKPSRLLRPAYPIRVVGEEQFRMAAAGLDSAVSHPLSYAALVMGYRRDGRAHRFLDRITFGAADEIGTFRGTDMTPWDLITEHTAVQNRNSRTWVIDTGGGSGGRYQPAAYLRNPDGTFTPGFHEAWTDHLASGHTDDIMRPLAQIALGEHSQYDTMDDLIEAGGGAFHTADELRTSAHQNIIARTRADLMDAGEHERRALSGRGPRTYAANHGSDGNAPVYNWDDYVESVNVRLMELTGGDPDLLHAIARGKFPDGLTLDTPNAARINRRAARRLEEYSDLAPDAIKGDSSFFEHATGKGGRAGSFARDDGYDRVMERLFGLLGAGPTDRLSRSPAFRQFHARRMQELLPFMTPADQQRWLREAEEFIKIPKHGWHLRLSAWIDEADTTAPTMASMRRAAMSGKGDMSYEMADDLARHAALDNTRWLLYDVHSRGMFMDAMRVIFPFGEAWKEVATRWLGLLGRRPGTVLQRSTQALGVTGSPQDWADVVEDPSQHGWLFTNSTGETVFTYPAEWFTTAMTGVPVELTGSLNGLTIMSSVLPGVGPVVQVPLSTISAFRDSPELEGVRDALFPYGLGTDPRQDVAGAISDLVLSPAVQRVFQGVAAGGLEGIEVPGTDLAPVGDTPVLPDLLRGLASVFAGGSAPENDRLFLNSVFDVMRYRVSAGRGSTDSQTNINRLIRDSTQDAALLYIIRGVAGLSLPSAPIPEFQVEGNDGSLLMLRALSDAYRDLQAEDYRTASETFLDRYGDDLGLVLQAKTVPRTSMLPVTSEADRWVQSHPGIQDDYPLTFGLYAPGNTEGEDFDFDAYNRYQRDRAMEVLGRELTLHDLVYLANDRVASDLYRQREQELLDTPGWTTEGGNLTEEAQRYLSGEIRPWLEDRYPGFGSDGLERGPSAEQLRDALGMPGQTNTEIRRAIDDDRIDEPIRDALSQYVQRSDEIILTIRDNPDAYGGATTYFESSATRVFRDHLRNEVIPYLRDGLPERYRSRWDVIVERLLDRTMLPAYAEDTEEVAA